MADVDLRGTLAQVESLERQLELVKRDLLQSLPEQRPREELPSLFGTVRGGDISEDLITDARRSLFSADQGSA